MEFLQDQYIESVKGILKEFLNEHVPQADVVLAFPDKVGGSWDGIMNVTITLTRPLIYVEFERELNIDVRKGKHTGKGTRKKRKVLTYALQIVTTGDTKAVLERDRIIQTITSKAISDEDLFAGKGIRKAETKFTGSYRVRESLHLARLEFYGEISFIN